MQLNPGWPDLEQDLEVRGGSACPVTRRVAGGRAAFRIPKKMSSDYVFFLKFGAYADSTQALGTGSGSDRRVDHFHRDWRKLLLEQIDPRLLESAQKSGLSYSS